MSGIRLLRRHKTKISVVASHITSDDADTLVGLIKRIAMSSYREGLRMKDGDSLQLVEEAVKLISTHTVWHSVETKHAISDAQKDILINRSQNNDN